MYNKYNKINSLWSKYRSMIWVYLLNIFMITITWIFIRDFIVILFNEMKIISYIELCIYLLIYNLGFISLYIVSKKIIIYGLIIFVSLFSWTIFLSVYIEGFFMKKLIFIISIYVSLIPILVSTILGFKRSKTLHKYIGFKETLFVLSKMNFKLNDKNCDLNLYLKEGFSYIEENKQRIKIKSSSIKKLKYITSTIWNRIGYISFEINNNTYSLSFSTTYEDIIVLALASNILRVNKDAIK